MIKYIEQTPSADEFNNLTNSVGWGIREKYRCLKKRV